MYVCINALWFMDVWSINGLWLIHQWFINVLIMVYGLWLYGLWLYVLFIERPLQNLRKRLMSRTTATLLPARSERPF